MKREVPPVTIRTWKARGVTMMAQQYLHSAAFPEHNGMSGRHAGTLKPVAGTRSYVGSVGFCGGANDVEEATAIGTNGRKESSATLGLAQPRHQCCPFMYIDHCPRPPVLLRAL